MRNFFLSVSFTVSVQVRIFPSNMRDIIIYVARWWEKCLSKHSLTKHTCSWHDKLMVLWTLNRQARKIFLHIYYYNSVFRRSNFLKKPRKLGWCKIKDLRFFFCFWCDENYLILVATGSCSSKKQLATKSKNTTTFLSFSKIAGWKQRIDIFQNSFAEN